MMTAGDPAARQDPAGPGPAAAGPAPAGPAAAQPAVAEPAAAEPVVAEPAAAEPAAVPLLAPRDGLPPLVVTAGQLARAERALAAGSGPVAVDAERASGFRYGHRAFLVQLRRE